MQGIYPAERKIPARPGLPLSIGLGLWIFAGLFLNLAIKGRTFADWNAEKIARRKMARKKEQN